MAVGFSREAAAFRREVCAFLTDAMAAAAEHPDPSDLTGVDEAFERALVREAGARGYLGISHPTSVGGGGRPPELRAVFELEVAFHDAPLIDTALTLAGGPLLRFGSPEQRSGLLRRMVNGEVTACIAYTEAQAGSDLAAVAAVASPRPGGGFELDGEKTLVTGAHRADWCLTIARTRPEGPVRQALSMLLVDMGSTGVSVVRRPTMNGWTLCDVRFDRVAVPGSGLVGGLHRGWPQLMACLAGESASLYQVGFAERLLDVLAAELTDQGRQNDPVVRHRLGDLRARLDAARRLGLRAVISAARRKDPALPSAMAKIFTTELLQAMAAEATALVGPEAGRWAPRFGPAGPGRPRPAPASPTAARLGYELLERVHGTIGGGTNETKRNLVAALGLGLAPERRAVPTQAVGSGEPVGPDQSAETAGPAERARGALGRSGISWPELVASGGLAAGLPGAGATGSASVAATMAVARQLGRHPEPLPYQSWLVGPLLALSACDAPADLVAEVASGRSRAALADGQVTAVRRQGGWLVDGAVPLVPFAAEITLLLVPASPWPAETPRLFALEVSARGVTATAVQSVGEDRRVDIGLVSVAVPEDADLGPYPASAQAQVAAGRAVAAASEMVGAAGAALDRAVDHAGRRQQFGQPIGTFQAVAHRLADALVSLTVAEEAVAEAAAELAAGAGTEQIGAAMALVAECCGSVVGAAHQVVGGPGIYAEDPLHRWFRRVHALAPLLGDPARHRAALAADQLERSHRDRTLAVSDPISLQGLWTEKGAR